MVRQYFPLGLQPILLGMTIHSTTLEIQFICPQGDPFLNRQGVVFWHRSVYLYLAVLLVSMASSSLMKDDALTYGRARSQLGMRGGTCLSLLVDLAKLPTRRIHIGVHILHDDFSILGHCRLISTARFKRDEEIRAPF